MSDKTTRDQIVEAADDLFYRQGFEHTSFSDIANSVQISRGNFYYHFKSKDEILEAVIARRLANTRKMLEQWENEGEDPLARIRSFIRILIVNWAKIKYFGCPVGTLCAELAKLNHASQEDANALYTLFRAWLREQFIRLGRKKNADALAMQLLARSQGAAMLGNAFQDEAFVKQEVRQMCDWLDSLPESRSLAAQRVERRTGGKVLRKSAKTAGRTA